MHAPKENGDGDRDVDVIKVKLLLIADVPSFCILKNIIEKLSIAHPYMYLIGDVPDEHKP